MSLVTLVKSLDTSLRDAVVQIEEWYLPKEAEFTGKVDEAGRAIYTLVKTEVAKVETVANTVVAEVKTEAKKVEAAVANVVSEVKTEVKAVEAKIEAVVAKANV